MTNLSRTYFKLNKCSFVVVDITIVWCWKDGYHCWEILLTIPLVHLVALDLRLMSTDQREQLIFIHELIHGFYTLNINQSK